MPVGSCLFQQSCGGAKTPRKRSISSVHHSSLLTMSTRVGLIFQICWYTCTRTQPSLVNGKFLSLVISLICPLQTSGWSTRGNVVYWMRNQCLSSGSALQLPIVWTRSTNLHWELVDHHPARHHHHHHYQRNITPQDPHFQNCNQMCDMTAWDIGTVTSGGGATTVQRVCQDGNIKNAACSCAWNQTKIALRHTTRNKGVLMFRKHLCGCTKR